VCAPTAWNPASQRISAGQRHGFGRQERAGCKTVGQYLAVIAARLIAEGFTCRLTRDGTLTSR
jgi:hypothetical protein